MEDIAVREGPDLSSRAEIAVFGGLQRALGYLHRRWVTQLGAAVDEQIEAGSEPLTAVWRGWDRAAQRHPGLASVLDYYAANQAVAAAERRHCELVASAAGCRPQDLPHFGPGRSRAAPAAGPRSDRAAEDLIPGLTSAHC